MSKDKILAEDIMVDDEQYRYHVSGDHIVIKKLTFGKDNNGYGGWSFHQKFGIHEASKSIAAWKELYNRRDQPKAVKPTDLVKAEETKLDTMSNLKPVADQINADYEVFQQHDIQSTMISLKIGLMLEFAADKLPHGQLMKWAEENIEFTYRHASRFRKLSQAFRKATELELPSAYMLCDPNAKKAEFKRIEKKAAEFVGDKTQAELLAEHGIQVKEPPRLGGHHPGSHTPLTYDQERELAVLKTVDLIKDIENHCHGDTALVLLLKVPELKALAEALQSAKNKVMDLIKAG